MKLRNLKRSKWFIYFSSFQLNTRCDYSVNLFYDGNSLFGFAEAEENDNFIGYYDVSYSWKDLKYNIIERKPKVIFYNEKCVTCGKPLSFKEFCEEQGNECRECFTKRITEYEENED